MIFTSVTEGEGGYVFTPLCMFVYLAVCRISQKVLWTDPDEILWTGSVCDKEELIQLW